MHFEALPLHHNKPNDIIASKPRISFALRATSKPKISKQNHDLVRIVGLCALGFIASNSTQAMVTSRRPAIDYPSVLSDWAHE
jgi:hypothetical protein